MRDTMYSDTSPGCFGISIAFDPQCNACKSCPAKDSCTIAAKEEMEKVGEMVNASDLRRRFSDTPSVSRSPQTSKKKRVAKQDDTKVSISPLQIAKLATMKKKPAAVAKTLFTMSIDVTDHLEARVNPFQESGKLSYLHAAFSRLVEGGFSKSDLKREFLGRFPHWKPRTAEGYVSLTISLLTDLGAIEERSGRFKTKEKK